MRKKEKIILIVFIVVGMAAIFCFPEKNKEIILSVGVLICLLEGIGLAHTLRLNKKMKKLSPLLTEEPEKFIQEIIPLIEKTKNTKQKEALTINQAIALSNLGEYKQSNELFSAMNLSKKSQFIQILCYQTILLNDFMEGNIEETKRILREQKELIQKFETHEILGNNLIVVKAMEALENENIEKTKEYMHQVVGKQVSRNVKDYLAYLEVKVAVIENNLEEKESILQQLKDRKLIPSIAAKIEQM